MKKLTTLSVLLLGVMAVSTTLTACSCEHEWKEATCMEAKTCKLCGETEGEALGHEFEEATCVLPEICSVCEAEGNPAKGHDWNEATCTEEKVCKVCEEVDGVALGHAWTSATCTEPKTCNRCNATTGTTISHTVENWEIIAPATCSAEGTKTGICSVCNGTINETVEKTEHTLGEWTVTKNATADESGEKIQKCIVCTEVINTEAYSLSKDEKKQLYKNECQKYSYKEISRNPSNYEGKKAVFTGEVIQVIRENIYGVTVYNLRVNVTRGRYTYSDTVYVTYYALEDEGYILEDDIITMYGELDGEKTYETIFGASVTIPAFSAEYIDVK